MGVWLKLEEETYDAVIDSEEVKLMTMVSNSLDIRVV